MFRPSWPSLNVKSNIWRKLLYFLLLLFGFYLYLYYMLQMHIHMGQMKAKQYYQKVQFPSEIWLQTPDDAQLGQKCCKDLFKWF
jgi:hypothetical protein